MHNTCNQFPTAARCQKKSDAWNREENAQTNVKDQMLAVANSNPIKWIVNVGDNFYFDGVDGVNHWHWRDQFENMYEDPAFHVPWFSVVGNHDYGGDCCAKDLFGGANGASWPLGIGQAHVTAQFAYDTEHDWQWPRAKQTRWVMPYFHWTKVLDLGLYKVQFFAIDTNVADIAKQCIRCKGCTNSGTGEEVRKRNCLPTQEGGKDQCGCFMRKLFHEQLDFLERELKASMEDSSIAWRFLIAHHPWNFIPRSPDPNGADQLDRLLSLLKTYHVQAYFTGHVHSMRHDIIQDTIHMPMTGSSGGYQWAAGRAPDRDPLGKTAWSDNYLQYGFAHCELTKEQLTITYINDKGAKVHTVEIAATPTFFYEAQLWGECDNMCGAGTFSRQLKCMRVVGNSHEGRPLEECEAQQSLAKPATEGRCFLQHPPMIEYCSMCSTSEKCDECVGGFKSDGSRCVSEGETVVVNFEVAAPPNDEWREELDGMLESALRNANAAAFADTSLSVKTFAIHPKDTFEAKDPSLSESPFLMAHARRLSLDAFSVRASVRGNTSAILEVLRNLSSTPGSLPTAIDSNQPDITTISEIKLICPELMSADATSGMCSTGSSTTLPRSRNLVLALWQSSVLLPSAAVLAMLLMALFWSSRSKSVFGRAVPHSHGERENVQLSEVAEGQVRRG